MKRTYVNRLPKNEEVKNTNVRIENGKLVVEVEFEEKFEPKDGDFLVTNNSCIFIYNTNYDPKFLKGFYIGINADDEIVISDQMSGFSGAERLATEQEKTAFLERLEKECGKRWNSEKKCLEDIRWRAKKNEIFYYLDNEGNNVLTGVEDGGIFDSMRYESNNYFRTEEAAQEVADQLKEIFKNSKLNSYEHL